jgi:hypothetical protein
MKKNLLFIILSSFFFYTSYAQYEFGVEGGVASCWITNKNVSNAGNSQNLGFTLSYNYGIHIAVDFTDNFGVVGNLFWGNYSQKYTGTFQNDGMLANGMIYADRETYTAFTTLKTMDIPLLLRFQTNSGAFVELGAEYGMINGANYSATYSSPDGSFAEDTKSMYASSNISGILGFGSNFRLNDQWFIITDFRIKYGFTDIKGVDGLGQDLNNQYLYEGPNPYYSSYQPTHTITGSFNIGIYYYLQTNFTHHMGHQRCSGPARARG